MKGLTNLKNRDLKCFMWCHVRLINPTNSHPERINKQNRKITASLNYSDIAFSLDINDYEKIEDRLQMQVNVFGYENKVYPLYISKKSYNQTLNLILITEKEKSHYVFIEDFNRLMFSKTKHKDKKHFCMSCLQNFSTKEILNNHRKLCLLINSCQAANYESGTKKFTNYNKQIPILFKIYAATECILKRTKIKEGEHTIKYQEHYPNSLGAKLACIDDRFTSTSIIFKGKNCINKFIRWVLDKQKWTPQITKKYFNKRLIMTNKDEEIYNNLQIFWICNEKINTDKVRDHCHVTGKFRGAAHNKYNLKLRIPEKLPIIFHNLQGHDTHIIFKELNNFDVDISVIPKVIDKNMGIIVNRHITFTDSLQVYNSSLDTLASNLNNQDSKYLVSEVGIDKLEILKRKDAYPYEWVDSYEKCKHPSLPEKKILLFIIKRW